MPLSRYLPRFWTGGSARHEAPATGAALPLRVLAAIDAEPWLIDPEWLGRIRAIAARQGEGPEALAVRLGRPLDNARGPVQVRDGIAIVPVVGPIVRYADNFTDVSGLVTTEAIALDLRTARESPGVRGAVITFDTPGGQATGIAELADQIDALGSPDWPVVAYGGGMVASAGYWLAAAAQELVVDATAELGSIGVVYTARVSAADPTRVEIVSTQSPLKRADPTTETGRAAFQARADALAEVFVGRVAHYRGVTPETVLATFGQGGLLLGATAVAAGMADRLGSLEGVLAELAARTAPSPAYLPAPMPGPRPRAGAAHTLPAAPAAGTDSDPADAPGAPAVPVPPPPGAAASAGPGDRAGTCSTPGAAGPGTHATHPPGGPMPPTDTTPPSAGGSPPAPATAADLLAAYPGPAAALQQEARAAGAAAERERIAAVLALHAPGLESQRHSLAFDGRSTAAEAALALNQAAQGAVAAEGQHRQALLTGLYGSAPPPIPTAPAAAPGTAAAAPGTSGAAAPGAATTAKGEVVAFDAEAVYERRKSLTKGRNGGGA